MKVEYFKNEEDITVAIVGSGGEGIISAGEILIRAASHNGLYGMMIKSYGPQIRGGEALAQVRLKKTLVQSQGNALDALIVLNWKHYFRFSSEIYINERTIIFHDTTDRPPNNFLFPKEVHLLAVPFTETANQMAGTPLSRNMVAVGLLSGWFGLPQEGFKREIRRRFSGKNEGVVIGNLKSFEKGIELAGVYGSKTPLDWSTDSNKEKIILNGNEAISLGALIAGLQFYFGYPITPASDIMEWMSNELPKFNGVFVQTEDEIAAITMAIGASFAGAKSMTATSGPGLSLMTEAIGLATMAELPLVIVDVQRSGPSTGIPTKTTQSDLFHAIFGGHGDLPRVVLAPTDVADAIYISAQAFYIAERYQLPVLILSDQFLGQRVEVIPKVDFNALRLKMVQRTLPSGDELRNYTRYKMTATGVSPISRPGIKDGMYTAYGIEHDEMSKPASTSEIHIKMSNKRSEKMQWIQRLELDLLWQYGDENDKIGILAWGSTKGVIEEAAMVLRSKGYKIKCIVPRQLSPLPIYQLQEFVKQLKKLFIFELSEGQFHTYLKSQIILPCDTNVYKRPGVAPFTTQEIVESVMENGLR